jgi:integrase/recombinase XerD
MSALADAARDYLQLRNSLGHDLAEHHRELPRFVAFLEAEGLPAVTVSAALAWAQGPGVDPATSIAPRRMTIARGFARYLAGIDARTEVPPPGLIAGRRRWRPPFIYSPGDIEALMVQARQLTPMPAATHETLIGLLAATGLFSPGHRLRRSSCFAFAQLRG